MPLPISCHCITVAGRQVAYRHRGAGPAVLLLHASPRSSTTLLSLMAEGPDELALYALDNPGFGLSDPLTGPAPEIEDFADALRDTMDALGLVQAALYGTHTGAAIALALAVRHPQRVSQLVLDGVSSFDAAERAMLLPAYLPPFLPQIDGSHLASVWSRVRDQALFFPWNHRGVGARLWRPLPGPQHLHEAALDLLRASDYRSAYRAALCTDAAAWVTHLQVPALIGARPDDVLAPHLQRVRALPAGVAIETLPADRGAAHAQVWAALFAGRPSMPAPPPPASTLPGSTPGDTYVAAAGPWLHARGCTGGNGPPLVLMHPSPGGPRSLEALLHRHAGHRPVFAPSLPGHGDSPALQGIPDLGLLEVLWQALQGMGFDQAEIVGHGLTAPLADALTMRQRGRSVQQRMSPQLDASRLPGPWPSRDDGGHLFAVWQHARDASVLGPWWSRSDRYPCGDDIDVHAVHRHAVEVLKEAPSAAAWRAAACAGVAATADIR